MRSESCVRGQSCGDLTVEFQATTAIGFDGNVVVKASQAIFAAAGATTCGVTVTDKDGAALSEYEVEVRTDVACGVWRMPVSEADRSGACIVSSSARTNAALHACPRQETVLAAWQSATASADASRQTLTLTFGSYAVDCTQFDNDQNKCNKENGEHCQYTRSSGACTGVVQDVVAATERVTLTCTNNLGVGGPAGDVTFDIKTSSDLLDLTDQTGYTVLGGPTDVLLLHALPGNV